MRLEGAHLNITSNRLWKLLDCYHQMEPQYLRPRESQRSQETESLPTAPKPRGGSAQKEHLEVAPGVTSIQMVSVILRNIMLMAFIKAFINKMEIFLTK